MTYNQGYTAKQHSVPVKRYCQTLNLKTIWHLLQSIVRYTAKKEAWPEIRKRYPPVGILEMEIYISGFQVFMIIETPLDFDWETAMNTLSHLPKQAEWEEYVSEFQECAPKSTSAEKWKLMERMFYLYD